MSEIEEEGLVVPIGAVTGAPAQLLYSIELWNLPRTRPERIIGQAASMVLARAIFIAAQNEHLNRLIRLRRGMQVLAESG